MISQLENRRLQLRRVNQFAVLVIVLFLVLLARLWYLQIALGDNLMKEAESNRRKLLPSRAPRGTIFDRKGRVLATSRPQFVVLATPETLNKDPEALHTLCDVLQISQEELEQIIKKDQGRPGSPVRVAIDVPMETVARIGELRMKLPGVSVDLDQIREYPDGLAVSHVMGYLGEISQDQLDDARESGENYRPRDFVGKAGLEKQYETELCGTDGGKEIEVNAFGRAVRILREKDSIPGCALKLTIDRDCQVAAYRAMGNQVGAVVAVDTRTGAVIAMVSNPGYDPNIFVKRVKAADWNNIIQNPAKPLQNRCVYNTYPPGSTFKPIVAVGGLVNNACNVQTAVYCPGYYNMGRWRFGCWKRHGAVAMLQAIAQSCDVWFYTLGKRMGIDKIADIARQFGIGSATGIDLPNESHRSDGGVGNMPDPAWKKRRYKEPWRPGDTLNSSIGQGYVLTSPLQMALVCAGVANLGKIYRPYLVGEIVRPDGSVLRRIRPSVVRQVNAPADDFRIVQQGMRLAVTSGTGKVCNMPDIAVAGKTGSAENPHHAPHGWFICYAPYDNPQIAVAAIVEHGRHGATTAAPICRAIMDVYFGKKKPSDVKAGNVSVSGD